MGYSKIRRLVLKRFDGKTYLSRFGFGFKNVASVLVHKMEAPDPGPDLHNHPWWFITIPLWGGYIEQRTHEDLAVQYAKEAESGYPYRGTVEVRKPFRPKLMRLSQCHTITDLRKKTAWSLVITGPVKRDWGYFTSGGFMPHEEYEAGLQATKRGIEAFKRGT